MNVNRVRAALLFGTLLVGGVLAPLTHFIYMASSDAVHHAAMLHHSTELEEGVNLVEQGSDLEPCTYADLFATQMAGDTPPSESVAAPDFVSEEFAAHHSVRDGLSFATLTIRGPPSSQLAVS